MATSSVRTRESNTLPPPPTPPGHRQSTPKRAGNGIAAVLDPELAPPSASVPPIAPSATRPLPPVDKDDFWIWLSNIPSTDWDNLIAYLWRTQPTIDRRQNGRATNIRKYTNLFDMERVMLDEGSGGYRVDVCWRDPVTGKSNRIGQHFFQIMNLDYPPRVPAGDWLQDPENETYRWAEAALSHAAVERQASIASPGQNPSELLKTVVDVMDKLRPNDSANKGLAQTLAEGMNHMQTQMFAMSDPTKQIGMLRDLMATMAPKQDNSMVIFLMEELRDLRKRDRERPPEKPMLEQLVENLPVIERLMGAFGFKRGAAATVEGTNWGDVVIGVVDKVSENIPVMVDAFRASKGAAPRPDAGFRINNTQANRTAKPAAAATDGAAPAAATDPGAPPVTDEQKAIFQSVLDKYGPLIQQVAPFLIDQFRANLTGYDFRDWFLRRQGLNNWTLLRDEAGAQVLTDLVQMHGSLRVMLQPKDKLLVFFTEFFTNEGEEPEGVIRTPVPDDGAPAET